MAKILGLYNNRITYDAIQIVDASKPAVIVDLSGHKEVIGQLHTQLGDNVRFCVNDGLTQWDETTANENNIEASSEFFFAPAHIQKRIKDWGAAGFEEKAGSFFAAAAMESRSWQKLKKNCRACKA